MMSRKNDHYRAFNIRQFPDRAVCYLLLYLYSLLHLCNQADFTCCIGDTIWHGFAGGGRAGLETTPSRSLPRIGRVLLTGLGAGGSGLPPVVRQGEPVCPGREAGRRASAAGLGAKPELDEQRSARFGARTRMSAADFGRRHGWWRSKPIGACRRTNG
jgi:hypothetical protein